MNTRSNAGIAVVALGGLLACTEAAEIQGTEAQLRAAVAAYDSAWQAKDTVGVSPFMAPEYAYLTSTGGVSSRARSLEFLADPTYRLTYVERSDIDVTLAGPVARVTSRWQGRGEYQGQAVLDDQTCGQTWLSRDRRWQLFTESCVNRPAAD